MDDEEDRRVADDNSQAECSHAEAEEEDIVPTEPADSASVPGTCSCG